MNKNISIHIPTPCHEDWNTMTPAQQGKFCAACNKKVTDFSLMSDKRILEYLTQHAGNICGRFDAEQLERPLAESTLPKKKNWWMALTLPFVLFFQKSFAQTTPESVYPRQTQVVDKKNLVLGNLNRSLKKPDTTRQQITIQGFVSDENNTPLQGAAIFQKGVENVAIADSAGYYSIKVAADTVVNLTVMFVGYTTVEKQVDLKTLGNETVNFQMHITAMALNDVIVNCQPPTATTGALVCIRSITHSEKLNTTLKNITGIHSFTVYPNPAENKAPIQIKFRQPGNFELLLLSSSSAFIKTENLDISASNTVITYSLPANIAAGVYYLRLTETNTKTSYTEKLVIR